MIGWPVQTPNPWLLVPVRTRLGLLGGPAPSAANQSTHVLDPFNTMNLFATDGDLSSSFRADGSHLHPTRSVANRCPKRAKHPSSGANTAKVHGVEKSQTHFCRACDSSQPDNESIQEGETESES